MEVNDGENFTVNAGDEVKFPVVEGIDIWYLLEENSAAPEIAYAPSKVVPDNYVKYDGNALAIEPGKTYRLTYIAKDTKTGLESNVKTVTFSTTTGITAIGTENGTAESTSTSRAYAWQNPQPVSTSALPTATLPKLP